MSLKAAWRKAVIQRIYEFAGDRLGIIGPHGDREAELLLSGAKPMGFIWLNPRMPDPHQSALDAAVKEGKLVRVSYQHAPYTSLHSVNQVYYDPAQEAQVQAYIKAAEKFHANGWNDADLHALWAAGTKALGASEGFREQQSGPVELTGEHLMSGHIKMFEKNMGLMNQGEKARLDAMVARGELKCTRYGIAEESKFHVYARQDVAHMVPDLIERLRNYMIPPVVAGARYQEMKEKGIREEGVLLGYTQRDINRFKKPPPAWMRSILSKYNEKFREARVEKMLRQGLKYNPKNGLAQPF